MEYLALLIDIVLHLDAYLVRLSAEYGVWIYVILIVVIFCETGLVVTPFLPGDSLLFAVGALAAAGGLNIWIIVPALMVAAIFGDSVNYWIGSRFGHFLIHHPSGLIKPTHLAKTHSFYEKYGGKTIVIARFVPIVRTLAPFVAGVGDMTYAKFIGYNIAGGILWIASMTLAGFFFGNIPVVKSNFSLVVLVIIAISLLPIAYEFVLARRSAKEESP